MSNHCIITNPPNISSDMTPVDYSCIKFPKRLRIQDKKKKPHTRYCIQGLIYKYKNIHNCKHRHPYLKAASSFPTASMLVKLESPTYEIELFVMGAFSRKQDLVIRHAAFSSDACQMSGAGRSLFETHN